MSPTIGRHRSPAVIFVTSFNVGALVFGAVRQLVMQAAQA